MFNTSSIRLINTSATFCFVSLYTESLLKLPFSSNVTPQLSYCSINEGIKIVSVPFPSGANVLSLTEPEITCIPLVSGLPSPSCSLFNLGFAIYKISSPKPKDSPVQSNAIERVNAEAYNSASSKRFKKSGLTIPCGKYFS